MLHESLSVSEQIERAQARVRQFLRRRLEDLIAKDEDLERIRYQRDFYITFNKRNYYPYLTLDRENRVIIPAGVEFALQHNANEFLTIKNDHDLEALILQYMQSAPVEGPAYRY